VLGGGITGLTSAYFASKNYPKAKITVYESGKRVGGWIESVERDLGGGARVVFERGPRTLRPNGSIVTAHLVSLYIRPN